MAKAFHSMVVALQVIHLELELFTSLTYLSTSRIKIDAELQSVSCFAGGGFAVNKIDEPKIDGGSLAHEGAKWPRP